MRRGEGKAVGNAECQRNAEHRQEGRDYHFGIGPGISATVVIIMLPTAMRAGAVAAAGMAPRERSDEECCCEEQASDYGGNAGAASGSHTRGASIWLATVDVPETAPVMVATASQY